MKKSLASALILGGACVLTASANAAIITLVNDTFDSGAGADTATYPRWTNTATSLVYSTVNSALKVTTGASANTQTDRVFGRNFTETTLDTNESLTLSYDFTPGSGNSIYRVGLFDLGASPFTDGSLTAASTTKNGYFTMWGSSTFGTAIRRDTVANGTGVVEVNNTNLTNNATTATFASTLVSVVYKITNTGTVAAPNISILSELHTGAGGTGSIIYTLTATQSTGAIAKFDSIFFLLGGSSETLDNVKLEYTTTASVPEPSSYAAGMGAVAALAVALRRKRRA